MNHISDKRLEQLILNRERIANVYENQLNSFLQPAQTARIERELSIVLRDLDDLYAERARRLKIAVEYLNNNAKSARMKK